MWSLMVATLMLCSTSLQANPFINSKYIPDWDLKVETAIRNKCLKNADSNAFDELKAAAEAFIQCTSNAANRDLSSDDKLSDRCRNKHRAIYKCKEKLVEKLEPCLDSEEKYLPHFLLSMQNATSDIECAEDAETNEKLMPMMLSTKCEFTRSVPAKGRGFCIENSPPLQEVLQPDYILKMCNFCRVIANANECSVGDNKSNCNNGAQMVEYLNYISEKYMSDCKKCEELFPNS